MDLHGGNFNVRNDLNQLNMEICFMFENQYIESYISYIYCILCVYIYIMYIMYIVYIYIYICVLYIYYILLLYCGNNFCSDFVWETTPGFLAFGLLGAHGIANLTIECKRKKKSEISLYRMIIVQKYTEKNIYHTYILCINSIALHCIALRCIALHCIALHYITLHYITLHTYIFYTYIYSICMHRNVMDVHMIFADYTI